MDAGGRPVRIANCSGFYGDRLTALAELAGGDPADVPDVITGDYLAEVTMLVLAKNRARRPGGGYAGTFLRQLEPAAARVAERGVRIVVNAGGLDPAGLAAATRELLARLGVELPVAHVEGDALDVPALLAAGHELRHLCTGAPYRSWGREALTANAYLGGFGVKAALAAGAAIVITGRVADASLVAGAAAWWWDWDRDDLDALAGAVAAGHVIECGAQATGGNFSGFREIGDLTHPGFPIAEIDRDGSAVITKRAGTGGAVTVDTVTAQLVYEIGPPGYRNPDVVARLDTVRVEQAGPDRVRLHGTRGLPAPPETKVAITGLGGWRNDSVFVITGLDADAKAELFERAVRARFAGRPGVADLRFTRIGVPAADPADQMTGSCLLHVAADGTEEAVGRAFSGALVELALANYPGLYGLRPPGPGSAYGAFWPALVPQTAVEHVVVHPDGRREHVPPPPGEPYRDEPPAAGTGPGTGTAWDPAEETVPGPLGRLVHARSGDKGGDANVGVWVSDPDAWPWLAATLTTERFTGLLPETAGHRIDRYELPNLRAVNFVVHGLLDGGATEARRLDGQAKALGEWLRARHVPLPVRLLRARHPGSPEPDGPGTPARPPGRG
jgi:Protein of unknown function (DUF1446).